MALLAILGIQAHGLTGNFKILFKTYSTKNKACALYAFKITFNYIDFDEL